MASDCHARPADSDSHKAAILIDLDGVIRHWGDENSELEQRYGVAHGSIADIAFSSNRLYPAIRGEVSDEQWRASIAHELMRRYPQVDANRIVAEWSHSAGLIDEAVVDLISRCDDSVKVVLSTNATSRLDADLGRLEIAPLFDEIVNSSRLGVMKPEAEFFRRALETARVHTNQAVFVDDSHANVEAARALGICSFLHTGASGLRSFLMANDLL